jgi:hypothetical protein
MADHISREEHLLWLGRLGARLSAAVRAGSNGALAEATRTCLSAECVQCGIRVGGEELLALGGGAGPAADSKAERLRLGYCARKGCDSYYYRIRAKPCPGVDWLRLFDETIPAEMEAQTEADLSTELTAGEDDGLGGPRRMALRIGLAVVVMSGLLVARHWYRGGTIPFIREPEDFVVDVIPQ